MRTVIILLCLFIFSMSTNAQVSQGDNEIQLTASILGDKNSTSIDIITMFGYHFTARVELGIGVNISRNVSDFYSMGAGDEIGNFERTNASAFALANFHFLTNGEMVPFITGQWYQSEFDIPQGASFTDFSFIYLGGGFKYFVGNHAALNTSLTYGFGLADNNSGIYRLATGISIYL